MVGVWSWLRTNVWNIETFMSPAYQLWKRINYRRPTCLPSQPVRRTCSHAIPPSSSLRFSLTSIPIFSPTLPLSSLGFFLCHVYPSSLPFFPPSLFISSTFILPDFLSFLYHSVPSPPPCLCPSLLSLFSTLVLFPRQHAPYSSRLLPISKPFITLPCVHIDQSDIFSQPDSSRLRPQSSTQTVLTANTIQIPSLVNNVQ